jgi:His/Glu/Gln/Arg/opine family amino acid ABC transporter permease subunit
VQPHLGVVGAVVLLALLPVVFRMEPGNFIVFTDPRIWGFIGEGVLAVVLVSAAAILLSLPLALAGALGRQSPFVWVRWPCTAWIEVVRALPLLLVIFYIFLKMPRDTPTIGGREATAVTLALTFYTAALNAELIRSGMLSLDRGQTEAARSLGLGYWGTLRYVLLPQTVQRVLAPLVAQFTILLKDTSLGSVIGWVELTQRGKIIFQGYRNPMETLYVVAVVYFLLNFALARLSVRLQQRLSRRS